MFCIIKKGRIRKKLFKFFERKFKPYHKHQYLIERHYNVDPVILNFRVTKMVYLDGYWQSEKYFNDIEDIIHKEFTVKYKLNEQDKSLVDKILNCESVSLHVRRGDNVTHPGSIKVHGICSMTYYKAAVDKMFENIKSPVFFIFSDDSPWIQKYMKLQYPSIYITHNSDDKNYNDLRLMSLCKNNIICNSTFSWWGAWLNKNSEKIVIAPKKFYQNSNINLKDLIPQSWIKI